MIHAATRIAAVVQAVVRITVAIIQAEVHIHISAVISRAAVRISVVTLQGPNLINQEQR